MSELKENEIEVIETVRIDENGREIPIDLDSQDFSDIDYKDKGISMDENFDFLFKNGNIRYFINDNIVWFIGKDICDYLEYSDSAQAIKDNVSPFNQHHFSYGDICKGLTENTRTVSQTVPTSSYSVNRKGMICVNEQGIYELTLRSRMPKARDFYYYVCNSVLPNVRRFGVYTSPNIRNNISINPEYLWWVNEKIDSFNFQTESQRQLVRDIAHDIMDIKLPDNLPSGELQAKFWEDVATRTYANAFKSCRGRVEKADKERSAATRRASKLEKQFKEEKIRHEAVEQELRSTIARLESTNNHTPAKKNMCTIIPDEVRAKLSYEEFKKLRDSLGN